MTVMRSSGKMVLYCIDEGKAIDEMSLPEFKEFSELFEQDIYEAIDIRKRAVR